MAEKRTTYTLAESKKIKIERLAIDASTKLGKTIKWTDIMSYLIDNYAKEATEDIISKEELKKKTKV
ncbi:hypothetical protein DPT14_04105 [Salmonella enterica subsp. enterica serovar Telelkebir]|nr:hypothetical protein [Salmonella enterica subsp. enterica serovar Telelkebir]EBW5301460.1 hypothetical protein [Salmonella enterica subsp. enterica serovar Telelkebir]